MSGKVEELLSELHLYHLMPVQGGQEPVKELRYGGFEWTVPRPREAATLPIVKAKYVKPKKRRLANVHNQSFPDNLFNLPSQPLVTVKVDHLHPIPRLNISLLSESTPREIVTEVKQETVIPLHKRLMVGRKSAPLPEMTRKSLPFVRLYRHIQGGKIESQSRFSPSEVVRAYYPPPYCTSLKGKSGTLHTNKLGYSRPKTRKLSEEIARLKEERHQKFDAIIGKVEREFELVQL